MSTPTLREAAEKAQPTTSATSLLNSLISYAGSTLRTNSKDRGDWMDDVQCMLGLAERIRAALAATAAPAAAPDGEWQWVPKEMGSSE